MSQQHDEALEAIVATTKLGEAFFPGEVPKGQGLPYAVYWPSNGTDTQPRFASGSVRQQPSWTIWCVGDTPENAGWVFGVLKAKLFPGGLGIIPDVPGEHPGPFWFRSPQPLQRDDDAKPSIFWHTIETGFFSDLT
ncbi:hypothetical protein [Subtercola sp. YIM 133946]|uniref:hypothetical protein n=1 Tax=Subtercola sp. YIM 133946 TaxID=3118909 RepID=UPI002F9512ED